MCDDTHVLLNGSDQNNVTELKKSAIFEKKICWFEKEKYRCPFS